MAPFQRYTDAPCWAGLSRAGDEMLVVQTGVGQAQVETALDWVLHLKIGGASYRPPWLVFAGFGGALVPDLTVGDVVWGTEVVTPDGHAWATTWGPHPPAGLRAGRLLTTPGVISTAAEKQALGHANQALVVDMESAYFARRCTEAGLRFGCVRAVSDTMDTALSPELVELLASGVVSPWRFLFVLARRPRLLGEMLRLARDTNVASHQLTLALYRIEGQS